MGLLGTLLWALLAALATNERRVAVFGLVAGLAGCLVVFVLCGLFEVPFAMAATGGLLALIVGLLARALSRASSALLAPTYSYSVARNVISATVCIVTLSSAQRMVLLIGCPYRGTQRH